MSDDRLMHTHNITLETLTPLHIGTGETLTKGLDYRAFNKRYFIIYHKKLIDHKPEILEGGDWKKAVKSLGDAECQDIAQRVVPLQDYSAGKLMSYVEENYHEKSDYRPFICDAHGTPYIPGSSLKGAIRTALAGAFLSDRQTGDNRSITPKLEHELTRKNHKGKPLPPREAHFENLFAAGSFDPYNAQQQDFFRFVRVTDAFFDATNSQSFEAVFSPLLKMHHSGQEKNKSFNDIGKVWQVPNDYIMILESIPKGRQATFKLRLPAQKLKDQLRDYGRRQKGGPNLPTSEILKPIFDEPSIGIAHLFKIVNHISAKTIDIKLGFMRQTEKLANKNNKRGYKNKSWDSDGENANKKVCEELLLKGISQLESIKAQLQAIDSDNRDQPSGCILPIGFGTGHTSKTGAWLTESELNMLGKNERGYNHLPFPKTLRMTADGLPLGFVKLTVSGD